MFEANFEYNNIRMFNIIQYDIEHIVHKNRNITYIITFILYKNKFNLCYKYIFRL